MVTYRYSLKFSIYDLILVDHVRPSSHDSTGRTCMCSASLWASWEGTTNTHRRDQTINRHPVEMSEPSYKTWKRQILDFACYETQRGTFKRHCAFSVLIVLPLWKLATCCIYCKEMDPGVDHVKRSRILSVMRSCQLRAGSIISTLIMQLFQMNSMICRLDGRHATQPEVFAQFGRIWQLCLRSRRRVRRRWQWLRRCNVVVYKEGCHVTEEALACAFSAEAAGGIPCCEQTGERR